jgi:hypothetical protein
MKRNIIAFLLTIIISIGIIILCINIMGPPIDKELDKYPLNTSRNALRIDIEYIVSTIIGPAESVSVFEEHKLKRPLLTNEYAIIIGTNYDFVIILYFNKEDILIYKNYLGT